MKNRIEHIASELKQHQSKAPRPPTLRRYKTNDATVEKLGELLRENPNGLLVMRDELVGQLAAWDKAGREGDRAFFLEAWNGIGSFDSDRIGRGTILIPNLCLSLFGGIQPDKLTGYLEQASNALANDGMLQRFQVLVYPDHCAWEYKDQQPKKELRDRVYSIFEALSQFDPVKWGAEPEDKFTKFPFFHFSSEAQNVFIEWSTDLHQRRIPNENNILIEQHLAKYDKLFPALALIFHLVDCAAASTAGPVSKDAALRAVAWCEYLESHARRCYGLLLDDGLRSAQALAKHLERGDLSSGFTARDVRRNQWRYLTADESVQSALAWLEDEGWLRPHETKQGTKGGRTTVVYMINPKVAQSKQPETLPHA